MIYCMQRDSGQLIATASVTAYYNSIDCYKHDRTHNFIAPCLTREMLAIQ